MVFHKPYRLGIVCIKIEEKTNIDLWESSSDKNKREKNVYCIFSKNIMLQYLNTVPNLDLGMIVYS